MRSTARWFSVGHSYGGVVISEAGTHPKVKQPCISRPLRRTRGSRCILLISNPAPGAQALLDPAAAERLPVPRSCEVRGRLRRRRVRLLKARLHGGLAGALGGGASLSGEIIGAGVEEQAELAARRHRRPNDPVRRPSALCPSVRVSGQRSLWQSWVIHVSQPQAVAALIEMAVNEIDVLITT